MNFQDNGSELTKSEYMEAFGKGTYSPLVIDCYSIAFDGKEIGPLDTAVEISHYTGEKRVTSLQIYPVRFHKDGEEAVRQRLRDRGEKYVSCHGHKTYYGQAEICGIGGRKDYLEEFQGDVVVDSEAFYRQAIKPRLGHLRRSQQDLTTLEENFNGGKLLYSEGDAEVDEKLAEATTEQYHGLLRKITPNEAKLSHEHLELLPSQVPAYILRSRKWAKVDIDLVRDFDTSSAANDKSFEDLVIPEEFRELLVALVNNHSSGQKTGLHKHRPSSLAQIDVVRGKGRGLIILLHGPPGTGKTSTAETIAAYTQRPLYTITCGDIGLQPTQVDKELERHFKLADRWGAVLLLDEADVFLVARDWANMARNALVSIFLRHLEYYSGILFLTSNRVGDFDEAFKSRIHVALTYPAVDLESTKRIWEGILDRITRDNAEEEVKIVFDKLDLLAFATKHFRSQVKEDTTWNGRQIRNAFQTAIALGNYDRCKRLKEEGITEMEALTSPDPRHRSIKLTRAKFAKIAKSVIEFERYMQVVQRGSSSFLAKENNFRQDSYGAQISYHQAKKVYSDPDERSGKEMSKRANRSKTGASSSRFAVEEHLPEEFSEEDDMADEFDE
ncbi:P-loop containing nucleoside triphosphate hydrolase protein [Xylaria cubensis]|nr:P-loop containing nucleoside triphosphate hydrolase protein [Xylaria cubensis]